jgi:hypothetical protein
MYFIVLQPDDGVGKKKKTKHVASVKKKKSVQQLSCIG